MPSSSRIRLDRLLVERGIAASREKAQAMILAGKVLVDDQKVEKCGAPAERGAGLRILSGTSPYVGRAGLKLEGALGHFKVSPHGKVCLDIGASTGGFTECLLGHGAAKVFAVDAGTNQLDWKLRQDPRVIVMEKTNARHLRFEQLRERADLVTVDVSFISATLILPAIPSLLRPQAEALILVKPQFEAGRGKVGKGGIVRDPRLHQEAVEKVSRKLEETGFRVVEAMESVLPGAEGNREFFVHAVWKA
ncbi:MAG: TlyA family RNA methyltransferase [Terriglobia bacterium]